MSTDTIIQFKYSDDVHMVSLYIKSDTHQETFIPFLLGVVNQCEYTSKSKGWGYTVAEIISKIVNKYTSLTQIVLEEVFEETYSIYKYSVTITEELYSSENNDLIDFLKIRSINCEDEFNGLLKDFCYEITSINRNYRIEELEEEIEVRQKELNEIKP